MKKFLLSLACVASAAMMASAETVTFDVSGDNGYGMTLLSGSAQEYNADGTQLTQGAVTITLHGNTRWWANSNGNQLRFYKQSGLTVTAGDAAINKIEFTPDNIKLAGDGFAGGVWSGNATSVTLNATNTSGNTYCNKITVTYGEAGGETPEPQAQYGKYEAASAITAGDYLIYSSDKIAVPLAGAYGYLQVEDATVTDGAIVALKANQFTFQTDGEYYNIIDSQGRYVYQTGTYNSFNVSAEKPAEGAQWAVTVNADGTFDITNVAMSKTIQYDTTYGSYGCYADVRGLKPVLYRYVADAVSTEPEPELPVIENLLVLTDFPNKEAFEMGIDLSVVYANGAYVYVYDGLSYGLIYKTGLGLEARNVIAKGWKGKVSIYNNLLELVPNDATLATTGATAQLPSPLPVEAEDAPMMIAAYNQSAYVTLKDVVFDAATPAADVTATADRTYTGKMGDFEVTFFQRFGLESYEAGTYDVTGFIAVYNDQVQVYPIAIETAGNIEPELPVIESLSIISDIPDKEAFEMGIDLTVVYANGAYVYVTDGISNALIYKKDLGLTSGDVIAKGWKGQVSIYNGLVELVPDDAVLATTGTAGNVPSPILVEAEDAPYIVAGYNQHAYITLKDVVFETATPTPDAAGAARTYTGKMGDFEVTFYQRFGLDSCEAGTYNVTGFVAVYNDQVQVYPIDIQKVTGINAIANDDTDARYYNINGIEVSEPAQGGIYIRVAGGKATKVIR